MGGPAVRPLVATGEKGEVTENLGPGQLSSVQLSIPHHSLAHSHLPGHSEDMDKSKPLLYVLLSPTPRFVQGQG